jgi:hypothetical protein
MVSMNLEEKVEFGSSLDASVNAALLLHNDVEIASLPIEGPLPLLD